MQGIVVRGVVVLVAHGVAHIYTSQTPMELLLDIRTLENRVEVGQWLDCSMQNYYATNFLRITPELKTEVINGVVNIETQIKVSDSMVFESAHFGKVAFLTQKPPGMKLGQIYRCMVSRDMVTYGEVYANLGVKWHILPNTITSSTSEALPSLMGSLTISKRIATNFTSNLLNSSIQAPHAPSMIKSGVVVGKRRNMYIIYTRAGFVTMIGRWKRENVDAPEVGQWIQFKSKEVEPKKYVVDSNSFRQVAPLYITTVENGQVNLIVPARITSGKIYTDFVIDTRNKDFPEGRLREAKVVVWADEKDRYRWKLAEKQKLLPLKEAPKPESKTLASIPEVVDYSEDPVLSWTTDDKSTTF